MLMTLHDACCTCADSAAHVISDAMRKADPTGLIKQRRQAYSNLGFRLKRIERALMDTVVHGDVLGLKRDGATSISFMYQHAAPADRQAGISVAKGSMKIEAFGNWYRALLREVLVGKVYEARTAWVAPYVRQAYAAGVAHATMHLQREVLIDHDRAEQIVVLAYGELLGALEATEQAAQRIIAQGIVRSTKARLIVRQLRNSLRAVAGQRIAATLEYVATLAHCTATLDCMDRVGHTHVRVIAEHQRMPLVRPKGRDAVADARKATDKPARKGAAKKTAARVRKAAKGASKISQGKLSQSAVKRAATPAQRRTIERREAKIARLKVVNVLTAGDNRVCERCQDISNEGPYTIDRARQLIPAHPKCRCAFVPFFDRRFAAVEVE